MPSLHQNCRVKPTLGSIRTLLGDEMPNVNVENRVLTVTISERSRPVAYFWSPHDFVRGVIGALLGHEYLCEAGILHCDVSENNIVLSPRRGGLGILTGFDMAIGGCPNMHRDFTPPSEKPMEEIIEAFFKQPAPSPASDEQYMTQRTASNCSFYTYLMAYSCSQRISPYVSSGVLNGKSHTHFDDIESFLYVLFLFFFSYKGPLQKETLRSAWVQGFIQPVGVDRLPHVTPWPARFEQWTNGTFWDISCQKAVDITSCFKIGLPLLDYVFSSTS
ncbi:hypothetical protein EDD15DRAFT_797039 [Pisolithus albus]|nr:hypothetical protein EDD15DRAFT_797039 [Pisolithus albus]